MIYILIPTTEERRERFRECVATLQHFAGVPFTVCSYENYREGFIKPIHTLLEDLKDDDIVWCIGDDTRLVEPDTLKRLVEKYRPGFIVQPDDGIQSGNIITMPLTDAKTMRDGTWPEYFLNYADTEFTIVATALGRYLYCPDIKVEHSHWRNGKAKRDSTYTFADEMCEKDAKLFEERKAFGFNNNKLLQNEK